MSRSTIVNAVLFQTVWFACVVGGGNGYFWPGVGATLVLILSLSTARSLPDDVTLALVLMPVGWLLDTLWVVLGVLDFHGLPVAPSWIVLLWLAVALTINHSLALLRDRPLLGALATAAVAPVSYVAGEAFGAVVIDRHAMLALISVAWFALFYGVFRFARGRPPTPAAAPV